MILMICLLVKAELNAQVFMANYWSSCHIFLGMVESLFIVNCQILPLLYQACFVCANTCWNQHILFSGRILKIHEVIKSAISIVPRSQDIFSHLDAEVRIRGKCSVLIPYASYNDVNTMSVWSIGMSKLCSMTIVGKGRWLHRLSHTKTCIHHTNLALWLVDADHLTCKQEWKNHWDVFSSFLVWLTGARVAAWAAAFSLFKVEARRHFKLSENSSLFFR